MNSLLKNFNICMMSSLLKNFNIRMIRSENDLKMHAQEYFWNESCIPQLFTRKFSPREPKCLKGGSQGSGWTVPM